MTDPIAKEVVTAKAYEEALMELGALLVGVERDFVRRVLRVLIHQRYKFMRVILDDVPADWTGEPVTGYARFEITELMNTLCSAARERDADRLAVVEHLASLPRVSLATPRIEREGAGVLPAPSCPKGAKISA